MVATLFQRLGWVLIGCTALTRVSSFAQTPAPSVAKHSLADAIQVLPGASCLDRERLLAHVRMWLGAASVSADVHVRVVGDATDRRSIAFYIQRGQETRHRAFDAAPKSCDEVHALMGLALALALDAERMHRAWLDANPPAPPARWIGTAEVSGSFGVLLDAALGAQAGIEVGWLPWLSTRLDLFAHYAWAGTIIGSRGRFDALLGSGSLQLCMGGRADTRFRLALCGGAVAGAMHAWGTDYAPNAAATGLFVAVRSGLRFEAHFGTPWLLDLDVIAPIVAPSFRADRSRGGDLTRPSNGTGLMVSLGPAWVF